MTRLAPLLLCLALGACADPATVGEPSPTRSAAAYDADELVLQVRYEGGFVAPSTLADIPHWSLYGDGRILTQAAQIAIYPAPALPGFQVVATVSRETVARIVRDAREAGVDGEERDYGTPPVADAATTVFELDDGTRTVTTRVYALDMDGAEDNDARAKLKAFAEKLTSEEYAKADHAGALYEPRAIAVYATEYGDRPNQGVTVQDLTWDGPDPAAATEAAAGRCLLLTGDALATALPAFRKANQLTRWRHDGTAWAFVVRPLLPDETDCTAGLRQDG